MQTRIIGTTMPVLEVTLAGGERIIAEGGDASWMSAGIGMDTSTRFGSGGRGGFMSGLKRALGGGGIFLTEYAAPREGGFVGFAAQLPGTIREVRIDPAEEYMVLQGSYVASTSDVEISVGLQRKLGAGLFGGAGLVFQRLAGHGTAWVQLSGEIVEYDLEPGRSILVHSGHLALYRAETAVEFASVKGLKNKLFGDSMLLAEVKGPGHVWLQSMTPAKLAEAIEPFLPKPSSGASGGSSGGEN